MSPSDPNNQPLLSLTMADFEQIVEFLKRDPEQLLHIPQIRFRIAAARIKRLKKEDIRTLDDRDTAAIENTVQHNLNGLLSGSALERPWRLIAPLMGLYHVHLIQPQAQILSVGPRSENEIFMLMSAGFPAGNITGLDLISYSPMVTLGDMHDMPFPDDSFDIVLLGWVLAYSDNVQQAVAETLRVAKPGAYVAVGWEYNPKTNEELRAGGSDVDGLRMHDTDGILALFSDAIDRVHFRADPPPELKEATSDLIVVFRLKQ